uniref:Uncharacterized protein n=1 Tax=Nelumbo nucifera TaxID=4432 RepID=A0A822YZ11_NELNU|nr:TPA_asm: hypothetical protein HUJ06_007362 [Nelumbo nucifera]
MVHALLPHSEAGVRSSDLKFRTETPATVTTRVSKIPSPISEGRERWPEIAFQS